MVITVCYLMSVGVLLLPRRHCRSCVSFLTASPARHVEEAVASNRAQRGRDGSDLARGFSSRIVAIGKNGKHAVMHTVGIRCIPACLSFLTARWRTRAFVIRCPPSCLSFLTARWHISIRKSLHASAPVVSAGTMAHQGDTSEGCAPISSCVFLASGMMRM